MTPSDPVAPITQAIARYAERWDAKDAEGFADLFTEDAVLSLSVSGQEVDGARVEGRQALLDYARSAHTGRLRGKRTRHDMSAPRFLSTAEQEAITENRAEVTHRTAEEPTPRIQATGVYRIVWRKTDDGWKIAQRLLTLDAPDKP